MPTFVKYQSVLSALSCGSSGTVNLLALILEFRALADSEYTNSRERCARRRSNGTVDSITAVIHDPRSALYGSKQQTCYQFVRTYIVLVRLVEWLRAASQKQQDWKVRHTRFSQFAHT
jgi:hypothetical protein